MLNISELTIGQESLRNPKQLPDMMWWLKQDGSWDKSSTRAYSCLNHESEQHPITISIFPDGLKLIQDGHHRLVATYLFGRDWLKDDEYQIQHWTYEKFQEINFANKWITPHNPITEVRNADFAAFKEVALGIYLRGFPDLACDFIHKYSMLYKYNRKLNTIADLAEIYG